MHDYSTRNIPLGTQNNRSDLVGARVITLLRQYAPPVVFSNFKTSNTLFKTVWTTYYQGCTENASQHSVVGNITAPSTAVAFPYLTAYLQVFCLFISIFWPIRTCSGWPDRVMLGATIFRFLSSLTEDHPRQ